MAEGNGRNPSNGQFVKGYKGGPGRKLGSRAKLETAFLDALYADFQEHGKVAVETARAKDPVGYIRVLASILPKEAEVTLRRVAAAELSDDELAGIIRAGSGNGVDQETVDPSQLN